MPALRASHRNLALFPLKPKLDPMVIISVWGGDDDK